MIKVRMPLRHPELKYEGVWVKETSANTGEINNLPMFTRKYKFKDIIDFDPETGIALGIIRDGGYLPTRKIRYEGEYDTERAKWEEKGYQVEGFFPGLLGVTKKRPGIRPT